MRDRGLGTSKRLEVWLPNQVVDRLTSYGQETHLRFRGVYPTEGSCRFPLIIVDAANSIRVFGGLQIQMGPISVMSYAASQIGDHAAVAKRTRTRSDYPRLQASPFQTGRIS